MWSLVVGQRGNTNQHNSAGCGPSLGKINCYPKPLYHIVLPPYNILGLESNLFTFSLLEFIYDDGVSNSFPLSKRINYWLEKVNEIWSPLDEQDACSLKESKERCLSA